MAVSLPRHRTAKAERCSHSSYQFSPGTTPRAIDLGIAQPSGGPMLYRPVHETCFGYHRESRFICVGDRITKIADGRREGLASKAIVMPRLSDVTALTFAILNYLCENCTSVEAGSTVIVLLGDAFVPMAHDGSCECSKVDSGFPGPCA